MAKTLQEILAPEVCGSILSKMMQNAPVHYVENVDGDPQRMKIACDWFIWHNPFRHKLIDDSERIYLVTCPECLATMVDVPTVIEVK